MSIVKCLAEGVVYRAYIANMFCQRRLLGEAWVASSEQPQTIRCAARTPTKQGSGDDMYSLIRRHFIATVGVLL